MSIDRILSLLVLTQFTSDFSAARKLKRRVEEDTQLPEEADPVRAAPAKRARKRL